MKQVKRAFALLLCVATVLSLCMVYASADNVCPVTINGDVNTTVTFYVSTTSKWKFSKDKVTLDAMAGKLTVPNWSSGNIETDAYGFYEVSWYKKSGDSWKKVKSKDWDNTETFSINGLKRNTEYKITVRPYTMDEIYEKHRFVYSASAWGLTIFVVPFGGEDFYDELNKPDEKNLKWDSDHLPQWTVLETSSGIMTCSK